MSQELENQKFLWIGIEIPFRNVSGTYEAMEAACLPPVPQQHSFSNIQTLTDLETALKNAQDGLVEDSPTGCYFEINANKGTFYRDQQDCVVWALDDSGVYLFEEEEEEEEEEAEEAEDEEEDEAERGDAEEAKTAKTAKDAKTAKTAKDVKVDKSSRPKTYVASSLGEFLYRIDIENRLWYKCSQRCLIDNTKYQKMAGRYSFI